MSNINSLPVAPEFVSALAENATVTALGYLSKTNAPQEVIDLVESVSELRYYLEICYREPRSLMGDRAKRFDIEAVVIEAVNAIARVGGTFQAPSGDTLPREK